MKKSLIAIALGGCVAGFVLRLVQLKTSFDAAGMIPKGDAVSTALYLVVALVGIAALVLCLRMPKGTVPAPEGKSPARGVLVILAGVALLVSYCPAPLDGAVIDYVMLALAFIAACAVVVEGFYHVQGRVGNLICGCFLPIYLAVLLVKNYRTWARNPLMAQFAFVLLFLVFAMVAAFELAAFRVGKGKRRLTAFLVAGAVCLAGPAIADGGWRNILHTAALTLYLLAEFWPFLKAEPIAEEPAEEKAPEETVEAEVEEMPEEDLGLEELFAQSDDFADEVEEIPEEAAWAEEVLPVDEEKTRVEEILPVEEEAAEIVPEDIPEPTLEEGIELIPEEE